MFMPKINVITKNGIENTDSFSYAFNERKEIYLHEEITNETAAAVISQLRYLDDKDEEDITIVINSPGGSVSAGLAIYDAMNHCKCDVSTVCTGLAASMGAFLLAAGTHGKRYATPHSEVMIHQPIGGAQGQASDIELIASHIKKTKHMLNQILAEKTGKAIDQISNDCDRDYFMNAEEALLYGIIDDILE